MTPVQPNQPSQSKIPTTPTVPPSLAEAKAPAAASLIVVQALPVADLQSSAMKDDSMLGMLRTLKNGEKLVAEAEKLAGQSTLKNTKPLLDYGSEAGDALNAVANQMIGETRMGAAGPVGQLFSSLADISKELDVGEITRPTSWSTSALMKIPFIGHKMEPVVRFFEHYKKVKPQIESKEQTLKELEVARVTAQTQLKALQETVFDGFRKMEVAIAAGEIVIARESTLFEQDRAQANPNDLVGLQDLKNRRLALVNLDNRVMRMQTSRADSVLKLPIIDQQIDNEEKIRSTLEDLRTSTIPQIRTSVAIAISIHNSREAVALAGGVDEMNRALRNANLDALGAAQEEIHAVAAAGSKEAANLVQCMQKFTAILARGNELIAENKKLNQDARSILQGAERQFKAGLEASLHDVVAQPVTP